VITRRTLVSGLASGVYAMPRRSAAQPAPKRVRIGVLANQDNPMWQGFRRGLTELGYVEGNNATIEWRWSGGHPGRLPALAAELAALDVDVIVTSGTASTQAAKQAAPRIPIVMALSSYPDRMGLVASLARPGGNITGLSTMAPELMGKRLELLLAVAPAARRVALLFSPASPADLLSLHELQAAAAVLRAQIVPAEVHTPEDFTATFSAFTTGRAQAMVVIGNPITFKGRQSIVAFALANRLPSMFEERLFVDAGGLLSYAPSFVDMFRRAADYVDKILKGTRPADLPVEQPTRFELVINLKTARALAITIPQSVRLRADEVIE
jgi:putative tryptophan/tyrosine transport system substrate-binding protein